MKRWLVGVVAMIFVVGIVVQVFAGYNIPPRVQKVSYSGQLYTDKCYIKLINFFSTTAGDKLAVYDANRGVGPLNADELEFEIGISANNSSTSLFFGTEGLPFGRGIYVTSSNPNSVISVEFDY